MATIVRRPDTDVASHRVRLGELDMFYLDSPGGSPPIVLLHGLSSNAHAFGGVIAAGLSPAFRTIAPDQRGRARTSKPASGYMMSDHAGDIIALMDTLGLERVVLGGHSFGGYLGIFMAANYPDRIEKLVVIDAAITSHPRIGELLKPSLARLTKNSPSAESYLDEIRSAGYMNGTWDEATESYFRAEIEENGDGTVRSATSSAAVAQAALGIGYEPWLHWVQQVEQPTLLINAVASFGPPGTDPLMDEVTARATARAFRHGRYLQTPGNHLTMMFGEGAVAVREAMEAFIRGETVGEAP
jgi:pimeloyl-ACP methyl ester carboxylesterase